MKAAEDMTDQLKADLTICSWSIRRLLGLSNFKLRPQSRRVKINSFAEKLTMYAQTEQEVPISSFNLGL
ncbi:MAG: hypothetical protein LUQ38_09040 [Methanotrichaceae archaeon]|nr:hypothetical protein [Methanotrichaceae archaeon]MDD1758161.1 hypothetical protein [Methanotrichaceae archaeon]